MTSPIDCGCDSTAAYRPNFNVTPPVTNPCGNAGGWIPPVTNSIFNYCPPTNFGMNFPMNFGMNYGMGMDCGCDSSMMNMGMPGMFPSFSGSNWTDDYISQMKKYQNGSFDMTLDQNARTKDADLQVNSPVRRVQNSVAELQNAVNSNDQDLIIPAFDKLKESVANLYQGADEKVILNEALAAYKAQNKDANGREESLTEHIRRTGYHSAKAGLYQGLTFGLLSDNKTAAENIKDITGIPVSKTDKNWKTLGNAAGGFVAGAGLVGAVKLGARAFGGRLPRGGKLALFVGLAGAAFSVIKGLINN